MMLRLDSYIEEVLYDPVAGYYNRPPSEVFGHGGDFVTAPKLINLFAQTLLVWVLNQWKKVGSPNPWQLVEAGAGDGTLMADLLAAWPEGVPKPDIYILEKGVQNHAALQARLPSTRVVAELSDTPPEPFTVLLGNELLDAFSIRQQRLHEGQVQEAFVGEEAGKIVWQPAEENCLQGAAFREWSPSRDVWLLAMKVHFPQLVACFLDYGANQAATKSTLQGIYQGQKANPLAKKSQTDITHQVNFAEVAQALGEGPCSLTEQAPFLLEHGLTQLALKQPLTPETEKALHRLLHPTQMGQLFKVLVFHSGVGQKA